MQSIRAKGAQDVGTVITPALNPWPLKFTYPEKLKRKKQGNKNGIIKNNEYNNRQNE